MEDPEVEVFKEEKDYVLAMFEAKLDSTTMINLIPKELLTDYKQPDHLEGHVLAQESKQAMLVNPQKSSDTELIMFEKPKVPWLGI